MGTNFNTLQNRNVNIGATEHFFFKAFCFVSSISEYANKSNSCNFAQMSTRQTSA